MKIFWKEDVQMMIKPIAHYDNAESTSLDF